MNDAQLPDSDIWFVRAERANVLAKHFLEQGVVTMGWGASPLADSDSKNEIIIRLTTRYPNRKLKTIQTWAAEILRFNRDMAVGDAVATISTHQAQGRLCHIGIIRTLLVPVEPTPLYEEYDTDHVHEVEWLYQIPTNVLSEYTQNRLGIPLTLHRLSAEASAELKQHCG